MTPERMPTPQEILAFYVEAGVDCAIGEEPLNRLADEMPAPREAVVASRAERTLPPSPALSAARPQPAAPAIAPPPEAAIMSAREAARSAKSLDELRGLLDTFDGCALKFTASRLVFADGNPQARLMFVGEAPGRDEDLAGLPFVGRSGQLLDRMIGAIGLDRTKVYIANIIPWRPPGNRTPTPQEVAICKPFLARQIELAAPEVLVCLGGPATQNLLNVKDGILKMRGRWFDYRTENGRDIRVLPTLHPAYLLRQPLQKRLGWRDFALLKRFLEGNA
jgi:uracil-DNA glycosylase family 4